MGLDYKNMISKLEDYLKSPEGQKSAKEFFDKIQQKEDIEKIQLERFHNYYKDNLNYIIEKVMSKYDSDNYVRKEYKLGYQPRTPLYYFLFEYALKYGNFTEEEQYQTPFSNGAYIIGNYVFALLIGQGSFVKIFKKEITLC